MPISPEITNFNRKIDHFGTYKQWDSYTLCLANREMVGLPDVLPYKRV